MPTSTKSAFTYYSSVPTYRNQERYILNYFMSIRCPKTSTIEIHCVDQFCNDQDTVARPHCPASTISTKNGWLRPMGYWIRPIGNVERYIKSFYKYTRHNLKTLIGFPNFKHSTLLFGSNQAHLFMLSV